MLTERKAKLTFRIPSEEVFSGRGRSLAFSNLFALETPAISRVEMMWTYALIHSI
ncbi:MAG: hypothetical protein WD423_07095 [Rhodothermales bacterium]